MVFHFLRNVDDKKFIEYYNKFNHFHLLPYHKHWELKVVIINVNTTISCKLKYHVQGISTVRKLFR